jgi:hypothetical protein
MSKREEHEKNKALLEAEVKEYREVLARLFASRDGKYLLKKLIRYSGIFAFDNNVPDGRLAEQKGIRKFFLEVFWQHLDKTTKMESME